MALKALATAAISSPPRSGARADRSPAPSLRAARFERAQPPPRRAEDHHRGQHRADDQHAGGDQREHRREAAEQKAERRLRRDDDDAGETAADHDRRRAREAIAAAARPKNPRRRRRGRAPSGPSGGAAEHRPFEAWPVGTSARPSGAGPPADRRGVPAAARVQRSSAARAMSSSGSATVSLPLVISVPSASITKNGWVYCAYCSRT